MLPDHLKYAEDVVAGRIVASRPVIGQCKRSLVEHAKGFVEETEYGETTRYVWDPDPVSKRLRFIAHCPHPAGRWRALDQRLVLEPWQEFFVSELYGWVNVENQRERRYREAILLVARKNGKTTWPRRSVCMKRDGAMPAPKRMSVRPRLIRPRSCGIRRAR